MVLDTSALLAILFDEPEAEDFAVALDRDPVRLLSSVSYCEAAIVVEARLGPAGGREFDLLVHKASIDVVAVTPEQAECARSAWQRFGRGRHAARLNLGDCFSYALSVTSGEPLLFEGDDFLHTDIVRVGLGTD
jgi:ribonuclease VapC